MLKIRVIFALRINKRIFKLFTNGPVITNGIFFKGFCKNILNNDTDLYPNIVIPFQTNPLTLLSFSLTWIGMSLDGINLQGHALKVRRPKDYVPTAGEEHIADPTVPNSDGCTYLPYKETFSNEVDSRQWIHFRTFFPVGIF